MKKTLLCLATLFAFVFLSALTVEELSKTDHLSINHCDGSGLHEITTDFGTVKLTCQQFQDLFKEFASDSGGDKKLQSSGWIKLSDGRMQYQIVCSGIGGGCNGAKADAYDITHNPVFQ